MRPRLEAAPFTEEDHETWRFRLERRYRRTSRMLGALQKYDSDGRDADAMLIMVQLRASKVVQVATGDWCWFGHGDSALTVGERLQ